MKRISSDRPWLPGANTGAPAEALPTGEAFRSEWIDFARGIRVGHLQPHERITRILKFHLENRHGTPFVTDRWGRGVFWQWICWLPRANREAKPLSGDVNFGCAKLFVSVEHEARVFKAGLQVERGYTAGPEASRGWGLKDDWDWHRLLRQCRKGSGLDTELRRLLGREGFVAEVGDWESNAVFTAANFRSAGQLAARARGCAGDRWAGFQLYYPLSEAEVGACTGGELVQAVCGAFAEVTAAMNCCMQVALTPAAGRRR